jgi:STE24 endopeptidase
MRVSQFLLGAASGFAIGYAVYRTYEATRPVQKGTDEWRDPARYGATRRAMQVAGIARAVSGSTAIAFGPIGERLERSVERLPRWLQPIAFAAEVALLDSVVELPVDFVEGYAVEHRYGLSEQSVASWISDRAKEDVLGGTVTAMLSGLLAAVLRRWPAAWPYIASAGVFPLLLLANVIVPIYIMPLFNTYEPIRGPLEERLRALASRYGVGNAEILRVDMSRQTKKANAFVTGIFNTHRIVVGDTLIENFPPEEIEFVVAHELGHYVSKDSWRMIAIGQITATLILFGTFVALRKSADEDAAQMRTLARVQLWTMLFTQALRPAISAFARSREWAADRFALQATQMPREGAAAFRRLRDQNLSEEEQPAWYEALFSTHPSLKARIAALEEAQLRDPAAL